jgi:dihydrofolate synthase/folylpolyglutamate synthase
MGSSPDSLSAWLSYLEGLHPSVIDMGLERVSAVADRLSLPRFRKVITVSGTNGKGSCVAALEALALAHGLSVCAYTSPHLVRFNERIRVGGCELSDERIVAAFRQVESARQGVSLTYFEFGTLAALQCFSELDADLVLLEVGLGGRLDAVNIIDADVAVITSIDLDHQQYLGDSRESVCIEKCGIRRPGKPLVCGDAEPPAVLGTRCQDSSSPLLRIGRDFQASSEALTVVASGGNALQVVLSRPALMPGNLACAMQAYLLAIGEADPITCGQALSSVTLAGRRQRIHHRPEVHVDVGHNPEAARSLSRWWSLQAVPEGAQRWAIVGMMSDKDVEGSLMPLAGVADRWIAVGLPPPRGLSADSMADRLRSAGLSVDRCFDTPTEALKFVQDHVNPHDSVIIFGSFLMVSEIIAPHA